MRKIITASALGLVMATPVAAFAQQGGNAELDALKQQVQALMQKVQELEAKQAADAARTEARVAEAEATNDNQTDQIAKASAKLTSSDWATKVKMKDGTVKTFDQDAKPVWVVGNVVKADAGKLTKQP